MTDNHEAGGAQTAAPPAEVKPSVARQLADMIPSHAHANGGFIGDQTWHWSTPSGVWLVTLVCPLLGSWSIDFRGNGSIAKLPANAAGVRALRYTLIAVGAIEDTELSSTAVDADAEAAGEATHQMLSADLAAVLRDVADEKVYAIGYVAYRPRPARPDQGELCESVILKLMALGLVQAPPEGGSFYQLTDAAEPYMRAVRAAVDAHPAQKPKMTTGGPVPPGRTLLLDAGETLVPIVQPGLRFPGVDGGHVDLAHGIGRVVLASDNGNRRIALALSPDMATRLGLGLIRQAHHAEPALQETPAGPPPSTEGC